MKGPNKTYPLPFDCVLLRNTGSVDPAYDGWFVDGPRRTGNMPARVSPLLALWFLQGVRRRTLADRALPA